MADVRSLEHPTLKVPYEILNKKYRLAQKSIDREVSHIQNAASELEQLLQNSTVTVKEVTTILHGLEEKLTHLKRKANDCIQDETDSAMACKRRLEHLKESESLPTVAQTQWKKKRLDRMLVEYFLRAGYYNTAIQLANHSDIKDLTNIDLFLVSKDVEESLLRRDTSKCLHWCHDNKSKLRKMKSTLEFNLRQQEFIELIRNNKRLGAVLHARKYFTSLEAEQLKCVQNSMGLLAFSSDTQLEPYKSLMDPERWHQLVQQFRSENFKLYQLNHHSVFTVALNAGLSSLKTPHCYRSDGSGRNAECPVCSKHLNCLANELPFAHCSNSRLICHMSGEAMNEHNPPMMLPNGFVYGLNALSQRAEEHDGRVVCPRTKEIFTVDQLEKVFVM